MIMRQPLRLAWSFEYFWKDEAACRRPSVQVGLVAHALFVDEIAAREPVEPHLRGHRVRGIAGDEMGVAEPRGGRRLEPAIAPAAVEIEPVDGGLVDEGRAIHRHVHDPAPG